MLSIGNNGLYPDKSDRTAGLIQSDTVAIASGKQQPPPHDFLAYCPANRWTIRGDLVERWFAELTTKSVRRGSFASVEDLLHAIRDFLAAWNQHPNPFIWTAGRIDSGETLTMPSNPRTNTARLHSAPWQKADTVQLILGHYTSWNRVRHRHQPASFMLPLPFRCPQREVLWAILGYLENGVCRG